MSKRIISKPKHRKRGENRRQVALSWENLEWLEKEVLPFRNRHKFCSMMLNYAIDKLRDELEKEGKTYEDLIKHQDN